MAERAPQVGGLVEHLFRHQSGRMVAYLTRLLGPAHLDLAEEAVQEALLKALQAWAYGGVPDQPEAWLFRVARNAALDAVRRRQTFGERTGAMVAELERSAPRGEMAPSDELRDDELRMIFLCCHPVLGEETRAALALKTVSGFSVREIARAFLAEEAAVAQRLVRAKRQIRELGLRFELPARAELAARLDTALEVLYLMFNEGYAAHEGEDLVRTDLCGEALRLARLLAESAFAAPRVHALAALMALQAARLPARTDAAGELVLLEEQERARWDARLIALGFWHFDRAIAGEEISRYHVEAAIAATHARARRAEETDWPAILALYDQLMALHPSPVIALNRAVAVGKVYGPERGLQALADVADEPALRNYHLLPAARGQMLAQAGDLAGAAAAFRAALARPCSAPERRFLERRLSECEAR